MDFAANPSASRTVGGLGGYDFGWSPDLAANAQAWVANPGANFGWILVSQSEDVARTAKRLGASEEADKSAQLTIQFAVAPETTAP